MPRRQPLTDEGAVVVGVDLRGNAVCDDLRPRALCGARAHAIGVDVAGCGPDAEGETCDGNVFRAERRIEDVVLQPLFKLFRQSLKET